MSDVRYIEYRPEFKDSLIEFLGMHWTTLETEKQRRRFFEWKYEDNPYKDVPLIYLAIKNEKIIGNLAYIVQKFCTNNKKFLVGITSNIFVHPAFRKQGVFSSLLFFSIKQLQDDPEVKLCLGLTVNEKSLRGHIKLNYFPIGKKRHICSFRFLNLLKTRINFMNSVDFPMVCTGKNLQIKITKKIKPSLLSKFRKKIENRKKIKNIRDNNFYNWRYSHPLRNYIFVYVKKTIDELCGYLILEKENYRSYLLMEYGYEKEDYLEEMINEVSKKLSIPLLWTNLFTRPVSERNLFFDLGFQRKENMAYGVIKKLGLIEDSNLPGALVRPVSKNVDDKNFILDGTDTRNQSNWLFFESDRIRF